MVYDSNSTLRDSVAQWRDHEIKHRIWNMRRHYLFTALWVGVVLLAALATAYYCPSAAEHWEFVADPMFKPPPSAIVLHRAHVFIVVWILLTYITVLVASVVIWFEVWRILRLRRCGKGPGYPATIKP